MINKKNFIAFALFLIGCGGNDEIGLTTPILSQRDVLGVWYQSNILDGHKPQYEKYDSSGMFVYCTRARNDTGTFRFLQGMDIERTIVSSQQYDYQRMMWIKIDVSKIKPDTINFHLNPSGFWVRGFSIEGNTLYTREWRKVDSLPYIRL